jgi:hypothetical protein
LISCSQLSAVVSESSQEQQIDGHARAVFEHRFAPLRLKTASTTEEHDPFSYDAYKQSRAAARKLPVRIQTNTPPRNENSTEPFCLSTQRESLVANAYILIGSAEEAFASVQRQLGEENVGPGTQQRKSVREHQAICAYLENMATAYLGDDTDDSKLSLISRAGKWLPPVHDIRKILLSL